MEPATEQLFGGALIGFAVLNVVARDVAASDARRAIFLANVVYNAVVVVTAIQGIELGTNTVGWVTSSYLVKPPKPRSDRPLR